MNNWKWLISLSLSYMLIGCGTTTPINDADVVTQPETAPSQQVELTATAESTLVLDNIPEISTTVASRLSNRTSGQNNQQQTKALKTSDGRLILGEKEWVYLPDLKGNFRAKVDAAATTSSLSAADVLSFQQDGKDWVKFKVEHNGRKTKEIQLPVERWVHIGQSTAQTAQERAVVMMWVEIGGVRELSEFNLVDRSHLVFPVLLGRDFFNNIAVVDAAQEYIQPKYKVR